MDTDPEDAEPLEGQGSMDFLNQDDDDDIQPPETKLEAAGRHVEAEQQALETAQHLVNIRQHRVHKAQQNYNKLATESLLQRSRGVDGNQ